MTIKICCKLKVAFLSIEWLNGARYKMSIFAVTSVIDLANTFTSSGSEVIGVVCHPATMALGSLLEE